MTTPEIVYPVEPKIGSSTPTPTTTEKKEVPSTLKERFMSCMTRLSKLTVYHPEIGSYWLDRYGLPNIIVSVPPNLPDTIYTTSPLDLVSIVNYLEKLADSIPIWSMAPPWDNSGARTGSPITIDWAGSTPKKLRYLTKTGPINGDVLIMTIEELDQITKDALDATKSKDTITSMQGLSSLLEFALMMGGCTEVCGTTSSLFKDPETTKKEVPPITTKEVPPTTTSEKREVSPTTEKKEVPPITTKEVVPDPIVCELVELEKKITELMERKVNLEAKSSWGYMDVERQTKLQSYQTKGFIPTTPETIALIKEWNAKNKEWASRSEAVRLIKGELKNLIKKQEELQYRL